MPQYNAHGLSNKVSPLRGPPRHIDCYGGGELLFVKFELYLNMELLEFVTNNNLKH